jgi:hypothetical protein
MNLMKQRIKTTPIMNTESLRFKDVSKRRHPGFVVRYKLADNIDRTPFQGYLISFVYDEPVNYSDFFCDVYPEFKTNLEGDQVLKPYQQIPKEGYANMWMISDKNIKSHKNMLKVGGKCYFLNGNKLIAECEVVEVYMDSNESNNKFQMVRDTKMNIHNMQRSAV